ncbi:MAG TPA: hypothetical protein VM120_05545 [Bryobacteraceae bacterium]|nr:hypothetical protein [Bryobacteraceae bacterium]
MNSRTFFLACLLAVSVCTIASAQPATTFAGEYKNEQVQLKIQVSNGEYTGTIVVQGNTLPFTARESGGGLAVKFRHKENEFAFAIQREGNVVVLTTDGATYRLARVESKGAVNPLASKEQGLIGSWRTPQGVMQFNADGTGSANGSPFRYQVEGSTVSMNSADGFVKLNFRVDGNAMTLIGPAGQVNLSRVTESASGGGKSQPDLAGKWCYVSNVYATGGGARASNSCFTLNADGRYEYYGETDSYGPNGGATSQSSDRGTWTASENSITARSASGRVTTYTLERKNHPKNNDPMLLLDGKAFVTFYQKAPWR